MDTPRPWNVFHLFSSLDKEMGPAFDESLADLKKLTEVSKGIPEAKKYDIQPVNFPATRYAAIRQQIKWDDMPVFFRVHFPILYEACGKEGITAGTATGLYFSWDEKERQTDMAAALPVPETASLDHIIVNMTDISASKAFALDYTGPYEKIREAYDAARDYFLANKLSQKFPVIEQYIKGPGNEPDTARWVTKIIFLVE
jgi:effector-binding domain-containing protein